MGECGTGRQEEGSSSSITKRLRRTGRLTKAATAWLSPYTNVAGRRSVRG